MTASRWWAVALGRRSVVAHGYLSDGPLWSSSILTIR
jgi:hypothetical protein